MSSSSFEKEGDSLGSLASGGSLSHDSDLNWLLSVSVNSANKSDDNDAPVSGRLPSQIQTDVSNYYGSNDSNVNNSMSPKQMREMKSNGAPSTREMRLAQRNQQIRRDSELNSPHRVEYTRSFSVPQSQSKTFFSPNNNVTTQNSSQLRNIVPTSSSQMFNRTRNNHEGKTVTSLYSITELSNAGMGGMRCSSMASTSLTKLSLTDSSIMQIVPRTLGQQLKLDGKQRSEFVYLRGPAKRRWKKNKERQQTENERNRKDLPDYNTKKLIPTIVPDPLRSTPSFQTSSQALIGLSGTIGGKSTRVNKSISTNDLNGSSLAMPSYGSKIKEKNDDILLQITLEEYANYQLACNILSNCTVAIHKLYSSIEENEVMEKIDHDCLIESSLSQSNCQDHNNNLSPSKEKDTVVSSNSVRKITVASGPDEIDEMLRRMLLENLDNTLKKQPKVMRSKVPIIDLSSLQSLLASGVANGLTLSVTKESSLCNLNTTQIRILEGAICKVFPRLLLTPVNATAFFKSPSLSSPQNVIGEGGASKVEKLVRVIHESQLKSLIAFKSPTLEMFAVCRLVYFFLQFYKNCGCHVWSESKFDDFASRYQDDDTKGSLSYSDLLSSVSSPSKKNTEIFKQQQRQQQSSMSSRSFFSRCATPTVSRRPAPPPPEGTLAAINEKRSREFQIARQKSSPSSFSHLNDEFSSSSPVLNINTSSSVASNINKNEGSVSLPSSPYAKPTKSPVFVNAVRHLDLMGFWSVFDNHENELFCEQFNPCLLYENFTFRLLEEVMSSYPSEFLFIISAMLHDKEFMHVMMERNDWKVEFQRGVQVAVSSVALERVTRSNSACGRLAIWIRRLIAEIISLHISTGLLFLPKLSQFSRPGQFEDNTPSADDNNTYGYDEIFSTGNGVRSSEYSGDDMDISGLYGLAHLPQERSVYAGFDKIVANKANKSNYLNEEGPDFDLERSDLELGIAVDSGRSSESFPLAVGFQDDA